MLLLPLSDEIEELKISHMLKYDVLSGILAYWNYDQIIFYFRILLDIILNNRNKYDQLEMEVGLELFIEENVHFYDYLKNLFEKRENTLEYLNKLRCYYIVLIGIDRRARRMLFCCSMEKHRKITQTNTPTEIQKIILLKNLNNLTTYYIKKMIEDTILLRLMYNLWFCSIEPNLNKFIVKEFYKQNPKPTFEQLNNLVITTPIKTLSELNNILLDILK